MSDEAKTWENSIGTCTRKKAVQDIYMMEHEEIFCLSEASPMNFLSYLNWMRGICQLLLVRRVSSMSHSDFFYKTEG
jgi:hypothetical protein